MGGRVRHRVPAADHGARAPQAALHREMVPGVQSKAPGHRRGRGGGRRGGRAERGPQARQFRRRRRARRRGCVRAEKTRGAQGGVHEQAVSGEADEEDSLFHQGGEICPKYT